MNDYSEPIRIDGDAQITDLTFHGPDGREMEPEEAIERLRHLGFEFEEVWPDVIPG